LSSENSDSCVVDFVFDFEELFFLLMFSPCTNECSKNNTTINGQYFHPSLLLWIKNGENEINSSCNNEHDHLFVFELFGKLIKE
jgi:hypothetical protein